VKTQSYDEEEMVPLDILLVDILPFASLREAYSVLRLLRPSKCSSHVIDRMFRKIIDDPTLDNFLLYCDIYHDSMSGYPMARWIADRLPFGENLLGFMVRGKKITTSTYPSRAFWDIGVKLHNVNVLIVVMTTMIQSEYAYCFEKLLESKDSADIDLAARFLLHYYPHRFDKDLFVLTISHELISNHRRNKLIQKYLLKHSVTIHPKKIVGAFAKSWGWLDYDQEFLDEVMKDHRSIERFYQFMLKNTVVHVEDLLDRLCLDNIPSEIALASLNDLDRRSMIVDVVGDYLHT